MSEMSSERNIVMLRVAEGLETEPYYGIVRLPPWDLEATIYRRTVDWQLDAAVHPRVIKEASQSFKQADEFKEAILFQPLVKHAENQPDNVLAMTLRYAGRLVLATYGQQKSAVYGLLTRTFADYASRHSSMLSHSSYTNILTARSPEYEQR